MNKTEISLLIALVLTFALCFTTDVCTQAKEVRDNTLRLHVIANDNTPAAQDIKNKVRREVANACHQVCDTAEDSRQAVQLAQQQLDYIRQICDQALCARQACYTASCNIERFYFPTSEYNNVFMPRGEYSALVVRLGQAQGKNWWCVLYPEIATACAIETDSTDLYQDDKLHIRLKTVEIIQEIKHIISGSMDKYDKL